MATEAIEWDIETDVVIIGSGVAGLSCGALLTHHGIDCRVAESHTIAGGAAHGFARRGFEFDSGPSLWNGLRSPPLSPLGEILALIGEQSSVDTAKYAGWGMCVPEGDFTFEVGPSQFDQVVARFSGSEGVNQWRALLDSLRPLMKIATALSPLALRADWGAVLTVGRFLSALLRAGFDPAITGGFLPVAQRKVRDPFILNWLEFLSFAISGQPAESTIAAAMAYTLRDLHRPNATLDYPRGGSKAVVEALVRGLNKGSSVNKLLPDTHVERIVVEKGRAIGVQTKGEKPNLRARKAVVSSASVWNTLKMLPADACKPERLRRLEATPQTNSFVHLHLGINGSGLQSQLHCHYTVINDWRNISAEQNMAIVSIPTTLDPSLAPPGCHVIHVYAAANEPYSLWEGLSRSSPEYQKMKSDRSEWLWKALERIIPDVRQRAIVDLTGSPLTHERFLRKERGTYGPAWRAGKEQFPGPRVVEDLKGLLLCGESTFPGIGIPAVAASGAIAAHTLTPVWKHLKFLNRLAALRAASE